jgi:hypothetical protein
LRTGTRFVVLAFEAGLVASHGIVSTMRRPLEMSGGTWQLTRPGHGATITTTLAPG